MKLFVLFLTASTLFNSAIAVTGNGKRQEKLDKYKTPQLVYFVDTVLNYLEKNQDLNPRHLTLLRKCQTTLNSNKKRLIGIEVVNIKKCRNLSTSGIYNVKYNDLNSNRINIFDNNKIQSPSNRNDEYLFEIETNNQKIEKEMQLKEQKTKELEKLLEELKEKQRKEQKEKELEELLEELKEKKRKEQKEKELEKLLEELKEKQLKEQKAKKLKESNIKEKTNLLFD